MDAVGAGESEKVRQGMARVAGAVSIVTVGEGEERNGLTVTSMISVSLDPPTLLFSINLHSSSLPALRRRRCFGVNVLAARHKRLADQFAGRMGHDGAGRYAGGQWRTLATGAAILTDALVAFDCEVDQMIRKHSHEIVIGRIRATSAPSGENPLLYFERAYEDIFRPRPPMMDADQLLCAIEL